MRTGGPGRARGHLDHAAGGRDLEPAAGAARDDLESLRALAGVDDSLDSIALHEPNIAPSVAIPEWELRFCLRTALRRRAARRPQGPARAGPRVLLAS